MNDADLFMGLDISMRSTGVAIVSRGLKLVFSGVIGATADIGTEPELDCIRRGVHQARRIAAIIKDYELAGLAIEGPAYSALVPHHGRNGRSMIAPQRICQLWQLSGIVKAAAMNAHKGEVMIVSPASLKKHATGNGRADKKAVIKAVSERLGVTIRDDNIADAAALALFYIDGAVAKKIGKKRKAK